MMKRLLIAGILMVVACSSSTEPTEPEVVWVEKVLIAEDFTGIGFFNLPEGWTKCERGSYDKIRILTEGDNYYAQLYALQFPSLPDPTGGLCVLETSRFGEVRGRDKLKIECRYTYIGSGYSKTSVGIPIVGCKDVFLEPTKAWRAFSTTLLIPSWVGPEEFYCKRYDITVENYTTIKAAIVCVDDVIVTRIYQK